MFPKNNYYTFEFRSPFASLPSHRFGKSPSSHPFEIIGHFILEIWTWLLHKRSGLSRINVMIWGQMMRWLESDHSSIYRKVPDIIIQFYHWIRSFYHRKSPITISIRTLSTKDQQDHLPPPPFFDLSNSLEVVWMCFEYFSSPFVFLSFCLSVYLSFCLFVPVNL